MSDENNSKEIQEEIAANRRALRAGTIDQEEYNKRLEALKTNSQKLSESLKSLGTSAVDLMATLKQGDTTASAYNGAIKTGTDVLARFATNVNPVLGALVKGVGMYAQAVNKQADAMYKGYQDISRLGATGSSGLTGVYEGMKKLGYGVNQLGDMQGLLADSATTLASLSGTVADGTKNMANVSQQIRDSDIGNKFLTMGISVDNMNKGIVSYLKIQTQVGQAQRMTAEELKAGAAAYIESADKLTKITGMSLQQQQATDQAALSEDRFGAWAEMESQKGEAGKQNVEQYLMLNKILQAQGAGGAEVAQGLKDMRASGTVSTEAAKRLNASMPKLIGVIQRGGSADEVQDALIEGSKGLGKAFNESYRMIGNTKFTSMAGRQAITQGLGSGAISERLGAAGAGQGVDDEPTKNLTEIATSARETRDNLQDMLQRGIEPVTEAMAGLAKVTAKVSGIPNKALGKSMGGGYTGQGPGGFLGGGGAEAVGATASKINPSANFKQQAPQVMQKLMKDFNLSKEQAAGIVGNLGHESAGLQAGIQEGKPRGGGRGGLGWAQWTGPRRVAFEKYLKETGQSATDPAANYGFMKQELETTHASSLAAVRKTSNAKDATIAFEQKYEAAGIKHYGSRLGYANEALALAGPSNGRQGVDTPDATQAVGGKRDADARMSETARLQQEQAAYKQAQLDKQQELIDATHRVARNTKKTEKAVKQT